jgi:hypothetical protein
VFQTNLSPANRPHFLGPMPSPSGQLIKVVIRDCPWLAPDTSAPLALPDSILPNRRAKVPGQLRALVRYKTTHREPGVVSLLAYSQRLYRSIPEFNVAVGGDTTLNMSLGNDSWRGTFKSEVHREPHMLDQLQTEDAAHSRSDLTRNPGGPHTDSGYASMSYLENKSSQPLVHRADDTRTMYSDTSILPSSDKMNIIVELADELLSKIRSENPLKQAVEMFLETLPELLKAFALKVGHNASSQMHRDVMVFIHKNRE